MPKPGGPTLELCLPLNDELRVYLWRDFDLVCLAWFARLQKRVDGRWRNAGPYVRGASEVELLGALVRAYRDTAALIEARYKHPSVNAIDDGCPRCGYQHPALFRGEGALVLRCRICGVR